MLEQHFVGFWSPFFLPNQLIILKESTNSHPFSCILSPPPHIVENYWTNQVHRSWATHWWYANAHHDLGHVSNMPKEHKCICSRSEAFILDATSQIEGLTVITSKEWIEEQNLILEKSSALLGTLYHKRTSTIRRKSCPSPVSTRSGSTARWWKVRRFFHVMSLKMGCNKIFLDFHIFDITEGDKFS